MTESHSFDVWSFLRCILGVLVIIFIAYLLSTDRKAISWKLVFWGILAQIVLAMGVLYFPPLKFVFEFIGRLFILVLDFTKEGSRFIFGDLADSQKIGFFFAFQVLPTIIFFSALTSLLFYWGIIQKIVFGFAWLLSRLLKLSGAESLVVVANVFLGQSEAPLLVKPYLSKMTPSEIFMIMTAGMATLSGGVLAVYIGFLGGDDPVQRILFAKHLLSASIMAAPGAVVLAKIIFPQSEKVDVNVFVPTQVVGANTLEAVSNGTVDGLKLAANIAAMLIVFISFMAMFNYVIGWIGEWTHINNWVFYVTHGKYNQLSLQLLLGYALAPLMWLIGVNVHDIDLIGRLLGEKIVLTEMIGYKSLAELKATGAFFDQQSIVIATYILCGFANFASIGIQLGGLGVLAPNQRVTISKFGFVAMVAATLASLLSATIVNLLMGLVKL